MTRSRVRVVDSIQLAERGGIVLLVVQLVAMISYSTIQYQRRSLSNDFGGYVQAWQAIGQGHLNPWVSIFGVRFLKNNFDLALYPLALIGRLYPNPVVLTWAQDLVVAAVGWVCLRWAAEIARREAPTWRGAHFVVWAVAIAIFVDPWSYETAAFPVHFEAVATLFALLAARALWRGERRSLFIWVPLAMASEALGSTYILAVGLGGILAGRASRKAGALISVVGFAGLAAVMHAGVVGRGSATVNQIYGYLDPGAHGHLALTGLVAGALLHLPDALHVLVGHLPFVFAYLLAGGVIGTFSPWGAPFVACVLLPDALSTSSSFIAFPGAFQNWPIEPFLTVGGVVVACALARRFGEARLPRFSGGVLLVLLGADLLIAAQAIPDREFVDDPCHRRAGTSRAISQALPRSAEVIADQSIVGAFGTDPIAYSLDRLPESFPVGSTELVLVVLPGYSGADAALAATVRQRFNARPLVRVGHVEALLWSTSGHGRITLTRSNRK